MIATPAIDLQVFEIVPCPVLALDREGCVTYANVEAEQLYGGVRQSLTGKPASELIPLEPGAEYFHEPSQRYFLFRTHPTADGGTLVFYEDITTRKTTEEPFRAIFDTTPECVALLGADGKILQMNASGKAALGGDTQNDLTGASFYDFVAPEYREEFRALNATISNGGKGSLEFDILTLSRNRWHMESHSAPLRRPDGTLVHLAIIRDVTGRKRRERATMLLSAIVDSTDDAIISKDLNGIITSWNKSAERLFGYTASEAIGQPITMIFPAERLNEEPEILDRLKHGIRIDHMETIRRRKDGTTLDVALTISPVKDESGKIVGASKIARDITGARRAERAAQLLAAIVDSSDVAIISKDLNGVVTSWNNAAERLFGFTAAEALGKPIAIIIPPDRLEEEPDILRRLESGERIEHLETVRRCKDGTLLDIALTISPIRDRNGLVIGASKIARDISEHKRTERAIHALNQQLAADLSAMTRMQQLSTRLLQADDFQELMEEIVDAARDITGADLCRIELLESGLLSTGAERGGEAPFINFFRSDDVAETGCASTLIGGERVVVEDISTNIMWAGSPSREKMLAAGIQSAHWAPLVSRSGHLLGLFAMHYRRPHRPETRELRLLDLLARQTADLIERKRAVAALVESEGRFRQLANAMPQIVWSADADGRFDYYNERWYEYSGFPRDSLSEDGWEPIVHPSDRATCTEKWNASIASGEPYHTEHRFWDRTERRWRWFMGRALPARDLTGAIIKWFGTWTDIDDQKRVEDELRRANQDLEQFAYSASHDLQEPLRSIKIYGELLYNRYGGKLDGQAFEFLDYLRSGASRMESLVRDLLAYTQVSRLEAIEAADAGEALAATLANLDGAIYESGATVTYGPLPTVQVHTTHLRQLFQNLIGNAIKYSRPETETVIHVSCERQNASWVFSVRDNGIGISPEYKERIFGLFKRLHTGDEYSGTGIGLAICQRIVERYRGRIWVESEPGEGSTFFFSIPV